MPNRWPYSTGRWQRLRKTILQRDRYQCQSCGRYGFEVHHKVPIREGGAVWDLENLEIRCRDCHEKAHGRYREKAQWERDWDQAVETPFPICEGEHRLTRIQPPPASK